MIYCTKCGKPTNNGIMCEDCIISDSPWLLALKRKEDDLVEQIEQLKAENAELRERLDKAVELPCKIGDKLYYVNKYTRVPRIETYDIRAIGIEGNEPYIRLFADKDWVFGRSDEDVFFNREAAEARLKELKEEI
mgnify:CR=1 FL=1